MPSMQRIQALVLGALAAQACVVGAPPGFSDGDSWSVPLVAPLEDDLVLVPVSIQDKGPYLFMVDPDSPESSVDHLIRQEHNLFISGGARRFTEGDFRLDVPLADVPKMQIGDLTVRQQQVRVHDAGTYWSKGRRIRGILGRDIIADSLVYAIDRDRGMLYIGTQGHLDPPPDAIALRYSQGFNANLRHYMADVMLNRKKKVTLHLDLGARTSEILPEVTKGLQVPSVPVKATLVDEYGAKRKAQSGSMVGIVEAGDAEANALLMLPFADKRVDEEEFHGRLGQNFFSKFHVTVNWHKKTFWLKERPGDLYGTAAERMQRWGDSLSKCQFAGCIQASILKDGGAPVASAPAGEPTGASDSEPAGAGESAGGAQEAGGPPPGATPSYALQLDREAPGQDYAYDALLEAVDSEGQSLGLPKLSVTFDKGEQGMAQPLPAEYGKASTFVVLDINVIGVRGCNRPGQNSCIVQLR